MEYYPSLKNKMAPTQDGEISQILYCLKEARHKRVLVRDSIYIQFKNKQN